MPPLDSTAQALVIGVSRYRHLGALRTTLDVPGVRDVLTSPDCCGYPADRVIVLEEEDATRDQVVEALQATAARASSPSGRTFIYFSGHGGQGTDGQSYLLPVDARRGHYRTTAISARELSRHLDRCAGELTVVLDCCRAAGIASSEPPAADTDLGPFTGSLRAELSTRSRVVFAASRADGNSYVSPDAPYGIFTGHLLDGLRGAASTDGGDVNVAQLFDYLQQRVVLGSNRAQRPVFLAHTEAFYPLTRYPRAIAPSPVFEHDVYLSYDRGDPAMRDWVGNSLQPQLEAAGCSLWAHDDLGHSQLAFGEAIVKSRYVLALLTPAYLRDRMMELTTTMAILQAVHTRTPRFLHVTREPCNLPLELRAFVGLDMTPRRSMELPDTMARLVRRLKKQPHER